MPLVVVAAALGELGPTDFGSETELKERALESHDSRVRLRGEADLAPEARDEVPLAIPRVANESAHRKIAPSRVEFHHGAAHFSAEAPSRAQSPGCLGGEQTQAALRGFRGQPLAQLLGRSAEEIGELQHLSR
jgi:hypothetical protein